MMSTPQNLETTILTIDENRREKVRVAHRQYEGRHLIDRIIQGRNELVRSVVQDVQEKAIGGRSNAASGLPGFSSFRAAEP